MEGRSSVGSIVASARQKVAELDGLKSKNVFFLVLSLIVAALTCTKTIIICKSFYREKFDHPFYIAKNNNKNILK